MERLEDTAERREYIRKLTFEEFDFLLPRIQSRLDLDRHVMINEEGHEFFRRLREAVREKKGEAEIGDPNPEPLFDGLLLTSLDISEASEVFAEVVPKAVGLGYADDEFSPAAQLIRNLKLSARTHWGTAIVYVFRGSLSELIRRQREVFGTEPRLRDPAERGLQSAIEEQED